MAKVSEVLVYPGIWYMPWRQRPPYPVDRTSKVKPRTAIKARTSPNRRTLEHTGGAYVGDSDRVLSHTCFSVSWVLSLH